MVRIMFQPPFQSSRHAINSPYGRAGEAAPGRGQPFAGSVNRPLETGGVAAGDDVGIEEYEPSMQARPVLAAGFDVLPNRQS
jgi:hypothetical protein